MLQQADLTVLKLPPCFGYNMKQNSLDICTNEDERETCSPRGRVLQLGQKLNESLSKRRHHVSWIDARQSAYNLDSNFSNGVDFIVESDE